MFYQKSILYFEPSLGVSENFFRKLQEHKIVFYFVTIFYLIMDSAELAEKNVDIHIKS